MEAVYLRRLVLAGLVFSLTFSTPGPFWLGTVRIVAVAPVYLHEQLAFEIQGRDQSLLKMEVAAGCWGRAVSGGVVSSGQGLKV